MAANFLTDLGILAADETPNTGHLVCVSISDSLTAAGSTAAGALALTSNVNNVTTTASGTGVRLPAQVAPGARIVVLNNGASALLPYPPTSGFLNGGSVNVAGGTIAVGGVASFVQTTTAGTYYSD